MKYGLSTTILVYLLLFSVATKAQERDTIKVMFATDVFDEFNPQAFESYLDEYASAKLSIVEIIGRTDHRGSDAYNKHLGMQRANRVYAYLAAEQKLDVSATPRSLGEQDAIVTNDAPLLAASRRVDVVVERNDSIERNPMPSLKPIKEEVVLAPEEDVIALDTAMKVNVVLEGLSFIPGRHYPTPESMPILFKLVNTMKKYPGLQIEIQGHICCSYDAQDGMDNDTGEPFLSRNRAAFVYEFLVENGIEQDRMSYLGLGSTAPKVFPEETDADRQANRRVEIKVK